MAGKVGSEHACGNAANSIIEPFGMDNAASGGHLLYAAQMDGAGVAHGAYMPYRPFDHVGDGLKAPMQVPREAPTEDLGAIDSKIAEKEKGFSFFGNATPTAPSSQARHGVRAAG